MQTPESRRSIYQSITHREHTPFLASLSHTHLHTLNSLSSVTDRQMDGRTDTELYTSAAEGTLPLGLVTMLFLVLFVWGCAGKHKVLY